MANRDIDASDPALAQAWKEMSDQKSENNWCLFRLENKLLKLAGQGNGGYNELITNFDQSYVMFGALKVIGKDNRQTLEAFRPKSHHPAHTSHTTTRTGFTHSSHTLDTTPHHRPRLIIPSPHCVSCLCQVRVLHVHR